MADRRPAMSPALACLDPRTAIRFLEAAFGFELTMLIEDERGVVVHAEMRFGDLLVMIGGEWSEDHKSPRSLGGKNTQSIHLHIESDIDQHCARARAAGGEVIMEPEDQFYGDRTYRCRDPEGHIWTVGQTIRIVSREEAEAQSGLKISGWV